MVPAVFVGLGVQIKAEDGQLSRSESCQSIDLFGRQTGHEVNQDLASWPPLNVHPTAAVGAVSFVLSTRTTPAAPEGASSLLRVPLSWGENAVAMWALGCILSASGMSKWSFG